MNRLRLGHTSMTVHVHVALQLDRLEAFFALLRHHGLGRLDLTVASVFLKPNLHCSAVFSHKPVHHVHEFTLCPRQLCEACMHVRCRPIGEAGIADRYP